MSKHWEGTFRNRMHEFGILRPPKPGEIAVSIKVRVVSGCFHREHSPRAYALIDRKLAGLPLGDRDFCFKEHESGPELLVYLAVTTAGATLAKSVIDLVTAIIKARSEGIRSGDTPNASLKLIVRRTKENGEFREEQLLEVHSSQALDSLEVEAVFTDSCTRIMRQNEKN